MFLIYLTDIICGNVPVSYSVLHSSWQVMEDDFNCSEDHTLMNGRLVLSAIGVGFAGYACLWDYLHPFPESRPVLIICALSYFVLMGILTVYIMYKVGVIFK